MTQLDKDLQEIALKNWPQFVSLIGPDVIKAAKACLLRQNNNSYGEIASRLGLTYEKTRYDCSKCDKKTA